MAENELQLVSLRDDFYRDGYYKALAAMGVLLVAIALLVSASLYLQLSKPHPVTFATGDEFRTLPSIPVNKPYLPQPDLIQWVSDVLPKLFTFDFVNYNQELKSVSDYFTGNGAKSYADQLKVYADYNTIVPQKLFLNVKPAGAPFILNQGLLPGQIYGWLIQMPLELDYIRIGRRDTLMLVMQALIVRIPTLNNLSGVAIEKLTVIKGAGDQTLSNG
ncbi:MAG TPA: DotI/IcmL/TraM family protein [Gammaproteobacteria bacterium]|nr:DotI/IcmL/TraM family protein [Gammaproteobacteria bacterium]